MATYVVASPYGAAETQTAMNLATQPGDIVQIPACDVDWTSAAIWNAPAGAQLVGAGTSATGGGDVTDIADSYVSTSPLLRINASGAFRMTGITVRTGTGLLADKDNGVVLIQGTGNALVIDHCHFVPTNNKNTKPLALQAGVFGVMYECILDLTGSNAVYLFNGRGTSGNQEWANPTNFGDDEFFFIEDCIINGVASGTLYEGRVCDGWTASKVVVRFNNLYQCCVVDTHGTGHSAGSDRGWRAFEAYGNACTTSQAAKDSPQGPNFDAVHVSNGTALVWGNTWSQCYKNIYLMTCTRRNNDTYSQNATPSGWGYAGTQFNGTGSNWDGGTFNGTDTLRGYPCIDQPGRGQGDLLTGGFPTKINSRTGILEWPAQALEPIYYWNNLGNIIAGWSGSLDSNQTGGRAVSNRDYYLPASGIQTSKGVPFNGTVGTGWGLFEHMPDTCTVGVAYWAIDEGSWNQSATNPYGVQQNGASGKLYVCLATNVWTARYGAAVTSGTDGEPYTYPHPLRNETGNTLTSSGTTTVSGVLTLP